MAKKTKRGGRFEIQPGQHRPKLFRNGALFAAFLALATYVMYFRPPVPLLSQTGYEVTADLADATNINPGFTPVRVRGINVGQVTKQEPLGPGQGTRITMEFDDGLGVDEVHKDATAFSRQRTLLGRNHYIDLDPGSESAPKIDGPIPQSRTGGQVEVDQAIDTFDADGRKSLANVVDEFNKGFASPAAVRGTVRNLTPAMTDIAPALEALQGEEQGDLSKLVQQTSRAMGALARDEVALGGLVDNGAIALGVTAARRADIGATLRNAPAALRQTRSTAVRLRTTLDTLDPLAEDLRPGARVLDETAIKTRRMLGQATPLLKDARPTFTDLAPAARSARAAAAPGAQALAGLQPTFDRFKDNLIPFFDETHPESKRKNFQMVGPALAAASSVTAPGDTRGSLARFQAGVGEGLPGFSPCSTRFFDEYTKPEEKVKCELLASLITAGVEGRPPLASQLTRRVVPQDIMAKLLSGKLTLKSAISAVGDLTKNVKVGSKRGGR